MIPVCAPFLTERDTQLVLDCLKSGWISSSGKYLDEFEERWASYCGMPHGIAVSNGSIALQLAMQLVDLRPGDEVIMPTFTIISCAQAVTMLGGRPVLVDSEPDSWQMNVSQVEAKITAKTKAIMVVHIYGHPADMDPLRELAQRHRLFIIEDAAEVHGAEYKGVKCGGFGDISTFSFYANKLITTGEGGMLLVRDSTLADRARSIRNLCFMKHRRFIHEEIGNNFRLTNMQAALGVAQIERLPSIIARKREIAAAYHEELAAVRGVILPIDMPWALNVFWVVGLLLDDDCVPFDAAELSRRLLADGIETRPFFLGMHEQPVLHRMGLFLDEKYPVAERLARRGLYLPNGLDINAQTIQFICGRIKTHLAV